jgi:hypothetical protein
MQRLGVRVYSSGVRASTVMASSASSNLEANKGEVTSGWCKGAPWFREEVERESGWSTATSTFPMAIYPKL